MNTSKVLTKINTRDCECAMFIRGSNISTSESNPGEFQPRPEQSSDRQNKVPLDSQGIRMIQGKRNKCFVQSKYSTSWMTFQKNSSRFLSGFSFLIQRRDCTVCRIRAAIYFLGPNMTNFWLAIVARHPETFPKWVPRHY